MIPRPKYLTQIATLLESHPVVAILGPRQVGKTTLSRQFIQQQDVPTSDTHWLDLEDPRDLAKLEVPMLYLDECRGWIIIDEIQRRPELFPMLRVLVNHHAKDQRYLILGSASRDLMQQSSESLAGQVAYMELPPLLLEEIEDPIKHRVRGGFPRSYLAPTDAASYDWRRHFITTFLERDIPALGINIPAETLRRFWMMLAHCHAQLLNASELGRSFGISHHTVQHYLDILVETFMVRRLQPWHENIGKRQVKTPKVYLRDSGLYHALLGIQDFAALHNHPAVGASWEGYALEQVIAHHGATPDESYFWAVHSGAELDLLLMQDGRRLGFEFKYSDHPKVTPSMKQAQELLRLDSLVVIHPGSGNYPIGSGIRAIGLQDYCPRPSVP